MTSGVELGTSAILPRVGLVGLIGALLVDCMALVVDIIRGRRLRAGATVETVGLDFSSTLSSLANVLVPVAILVAAVTFGWWFFACYRRLADFGQADHRSMWAIVGWLIPGLNLVRPPQIMGELATKPDHGRTGPTSIVVLAWWLLWIEGAIIQVALRFITPTTSLGWSNWQWAALLSNLILLASIACGLWLVSVVATHQSGLRLANGS